MTQPVENVVTAVVALIDGVAGLQQVPVNPPETVNVATYALVYAENGNIDNGVVGSKKALHNISIDVLTKRTDLARDMGRIKPFVDLIPAALLADPTLTGTAQTFEGLSYEFITPEYAGVANIGYKFILQNVKILTAL
jgi:hypothetical protein